MEIFKQLLENKDMKFFEKKLETVNSSKIDLGTSKMYNNQEIAFLLCNFDSIYSEYVIKCSEKNIVPIPIKDAEQIIDAINGYNIPKILFSYPCYSKTKDYYFALDLLAVKEKNVVNLKRIIIVPDSIQSLINSQNIESFMKEKYVKIKNYEDLIIDDESKAFKWNEYEFIGRSDVSSFTNNDWKNVACIFLDGSQWQFKNWNVPNLVEIFGRIPTFYVHFNYQTSDFLKDYNVSYISVDENTKKVLSGYDLLNKIIDNLNK